MNRSSPFRPTGVGWALVLGLALVAAPSAVRAQSKPEPEKKAAETKAPEKAADPGSKLTEETKKGLVGPRPLKPTTAVKPIQPNRTQPKGAQIPEPTVVLKPGETPEIKFDMTTYDFGRIRAGGDVVHDFWFTNTGSGPLEILRVKPG
ncbi:MAG TPA: DUF1573 domain-containing protein [Phycisphaerae bacterium]|nr:DUF1573 domain-containing protein [Phycisphaerae bacterium]HRW52075.1 DUF1573 domain-containing protein [Phycisphaerae bacterium]